MTEQPSRAKKAAPSPSAVAKRATAELAELLGLDAESMIGLRGTDDGWCIDVEFVELHRIPNTADVIAHYEISADRRGRLTGYRRVRRYARDRVGDDI